MQTSVNLQEPYTYSLIPLLISLTVLILLAIVYFIYYREVKEEKKIEEDEKRRIINKVTKKKNISDIKEKYLRQLNSVEYRYNNEIIELRTAYQLISENIRLFIFEVTNIKAQNYTLEEIKNLNMPHVYNLIKEYYEPEFASETVGDFKTSINKARRIIERWN